MGVVHRSAALLLTVVLALAACGGSDEPSAPPPEPTPSAQASDFPAVEGRTLQDLQSMAEEGPVLAPSVSVLEKGENRFGFALFDTARKPIEAGAVALYVARRDGTGLKGPFLARNEPLAVEPEFQSTSTVDDPDAAKTVYVADVEFDRNGESVVFGLVQLDGRLVSTGAQSVAVGRGKEVPDVGEKAIEVSTETIASSGGNLELLTTRRPPARELLQTDFADVLGKKPVVITFATPLLCASRVCGPVVDIVE
jgi:predicted small lipoprotein YifL